MRQNDDRESGKWRIPHMAPHARCVLVASVLIGAAPAARATGYVCAPLPLRLIRADAVVVGRTIAVEVREPRPGLKIHTYRFRVEEVIKGTAYRVGDEVVEDSRGSFSNITHLPPAQWGRYVVFLGPAGEGKLRAGPCKDPASNDQILTLRRIAQVATQPDRFLDATDETAVLTVLYWIRWSYFASSSGLDVETASPEAFAMLPRRRAIEYVFQHLDASHAKRYALAVDLLAGFHPTEGYEVLVAALRSEDHNVVRSAALGLARLGELRAVEPLLNKLSAARCARVRKIQRQVPAWTDDGRPYQKTVTEPDPTYNAVGGALIAALGRLGDPTAVDALVAELEGWHDQQAVQALAAIGDPRAVPTLLKFAWTRSSVDAKSLARFNDPRIVEAARLRIYDHPTAPKILAESGDRSSETVAFMRRLARQGHWDAAEWAIVTRDERLIDDLKHGLSHTGSSSVWFSMALARLRAFEIIPELIGNTEPHFAKHARIGFLVGLLIEDLERERIEQMDAFLAQTPSRIDQLARQEAWNDGQRNEVLRLAAAVQHDAAELVAVLMTWNTAEMWHPPASLPQMPDPLDRERTRRFLEQNYEQAIAALKAAPRSERITIIQALEQAKLSIPADMLVDFLLDPSLTLRSAAARILRSADVQLTAARVRRWALTGDHSATTQALRYIHEHARRGDAATVVEVFNRGSHLFDENLFKSIIVTGARACLEPLRTMLQHEHIDLRRRAAITLAFFHDDAGRDVILQEHERLKLRSHSRELRHVEGGLRALGELD